VIADPCTTCHGAGRIKKHKTLSVKIPAGVDQDDRIRLDGRRRSGNERRPAGDLYVVVNLKPHAVFQREGADLHCEMPISFATAGARRRDRDSDARGSREGQGSRRDADGPGVQAAQQRHPAGARLGDRRSLCHVAVETPVKLTSRQKELLREFEEINERDPGAHNPRAKSFMDKVRDFFAP
jgi:molecular chaperone DnaJ